MIFQKVLHIPVRTRGFRPRLSVVDASRLWQQTRSSSTPLRRCSLLRVRTVRRGRLPRRGCCRHAVAWAAMRSTDSIDEAEMLVGYGDQGLPLAGAGAPLVAEFAVTSSPPPGPVHRRGQGVCRAGPRFPAPAPPGVAPGGPRVTCGPGRLVGSPSAPSCCLREAVAFVDAHVAATAHKIGPYQLHALVEQAIAQPHARPGRGTTPREGRRTLLHHRAAREFLDGTAAVHGELDLADAHDLETAVAGRGRPAQGPRLRTDPRRPPSNGRRRASAP